MKQWQNKSCMQSILAFKPHIGSQRLKCEEEMGGGEGGNTHLQCHGYSHQDSDAYPTEKLGRRWHLMTGKIDWRNL